MLLVDDRSVSKSEAGMELPVGDPLTNVLAPECWTKNTGTSLLWARSMRVLILWRAGRPVGRFVKSPCWTSMTSRRRYSDLRSVGCLLLLSF